MGELRRSERAGRSGAVGEAEDCLGVGPVTVFGEARPRPVAVCATDSILPATWDAGHWRDRAACRSVAVDVFFPVGVVGEAEIQVAKAKLICSTCAVRSECLEFALRSNQEYGVWGGANEEERRVLRRRRRVAARLATAS